MQDGSEDFREGFSRRSLTSRNVRRRLFADEEENEGSDSRQGLDENKANELFEEARNNLKKARERWNFDFETETPLPGKYEWIKLDKDGNEVPNFVPESRQNETHEASDTSHPEESK